MAYKVKVVDPRTSGLVQRMQQTGQRIMLNPQTKGFIVRQGDRFVELQKGYSDPITPSPIAATLKGLVGRAVPPETFQQVKTGAGTVSNTNDGTGINTSAAPDKYNFMYRYRMSFNTASIPTNALITSAVLGIRVNGKYNAYANPASEIALSFIKANTFSDAVGDYQQFVFTRITDDINYADIAIPATLALTLNAAGKNHINKGGITYIGATFAADVDNLSDFTNPVPAGSLNTIIYTFTNTNTYLTITYQLPL